MLISHLALSQERRDGIAMGRGREADRLGELLGRDRLLPGFWKIVLDGAWLPWVEVEIRDAREGDLGIIAELLGELGYPTAPEELPLRLDRLATEAGTGVLVAVAEDGASAGDGAGPAAVGSQPGEPIAVLAYAEFQPLERPLPTCRITTLVVSSGHRREGVAAALLDAVETRARKRGCERLEVTTQPKREAALALYTAAGYVEKPRRLVRVLAG
jgi:GNAT superfamily N-acetyltransferase